MESIGLGLFLGLCVLFDVKTDRIPNRLSLFGLISGLLSSVMLYGFRILPSRLLWTLLPVLVLILLFKYRVIGAGDIKLLCVCGAYAGERVIVVCAGMFLLTAVCGVIRLLISSLTGADFKSRIHMSVPAFLSLLIANCAQYLKSAF